MPEATIETITPARAHEYLSLNKLNRPVSENHVINLVLKQRRGEWQFNGDPLRFDTTGALRDGQHRLHMVIRSGIPIEAVVVRGVAPDSFVTMDIGKSRTFADDLAIKGKAEPAKLAAATVWLSRYLWGHLGQTRSSYEEYESVLDKHPQLSDSLAFMAKQGEQTKNPPGNTAVVTVVHYLLCQIDKEKADDFIGRYWTGLRLETSNDPIRVVREQVIHNRASRDPSYSEGQVLWLLFRAWNAYVTTGELRQKIKLPDRPQDRPIFAGFPRELFLRRARTATEQLILDAEEELAEESLVEASPVDLSS